MVTKNIISVFTLNIGNTHAKLVAWSKGAIEARFEWSTSEKNPKLGKWFGNSDAPVLIAGVVPAYKERLAAHVQKSGRRVLIFRRDVKPFLKIAPSPAAKVGDDRIAGALGALFIKADRPWVTIDVGTAMTINAIRPGSAKKPPRFEGGLIVASATTSLRALNQFTAQLPLFDNLKGSGSKSFLGRNTQEAMALGVWHAQIAAAITIAKGQIRELGPRTLIALTGGGAGGLDYSTEFRSAFPRRIYSIKELVHLGLYSAWLQSGRKHG